MIKVYPEQLTQHLEKSLMPFYLVSGNDPLQQQESVDTLCEQARKQGFAEKKSYTLDNQLNWDDVYNDCQTLSLFSSQKILLLQAGETNLTATIGEHLLELYQNAGTETLFILQATKITRSQENSRWFKALDKLVWIQCQTPEGANLTRWITQRSTAMQLHLDEPSLQLLSFYYEGNLLALNQTLERLSLLYPDGKLTLPRLEQAINDASYFTPYHWIDALLAGKTKRAIHILLKLHETDTEALILLRLIQKELLLLIRLKKGMQHTPLKTLFDQERIWQNRRPHYNRLLNELEPSQLYLALNQLTEIEISLKQDFNNNVWWELERLTLTLCGKSVF